MQDVLADTLPILGACLVIAAFAVALVILRPTARRRRRHNRRSKRPKIDLFKPAQAGAVPEADA